MKEYVLEETRRLLSEKLRGTAIEDFDLVEWMRILMVLNGLTYAELGARCGVSKQAVQQVLFSRSIPNAKMMQVLSDIAGIDKEAWLYPRVKACLMRRQARVIDERLHRCGFLIYRPRKARKEE